MTAFSDTSIDELKPGERRYDLPVDDEFMLSVLPNGIKTWVYVYQDKGRLRRRTLGVHPEMSLHQAREALAAARSFTEKFQGLAAPQTASRPTPAAVPPAGGRRWWGVSLTGAGIVAAVVFLVWRNSADVPSPVSTSPDEAPGIAALAANIETMAPSPTPPAIDQPAANVQRQALDTAAAVPASAPPASVPASIPRGDEGAIAASEMAPEDPVADSASAEPGVADANAAPAPETLAALTGDVSRQEAELAEEVPPPMETERALASDIVAENAAPAEIDPADAANNPPARRSTGTLARAQLTSAVVNREPQDTLDALVKGREGETSTVFYFTEVRGLAGRTITHVWTLDDEVVAEVPIEVGQSWRWRAYSQKDLLSTMAGRWTVSLLDDNGVVMSEARFEYQVEASGSESDTPPAGSR